MNSTIRKIIDKLQTYPEVKYTNTEDLVTVDPKDDKGFSVTLGVGPREFIVSSDFWHEHFDKDEEDKALDCFSFMLSDACRLKIEYKGEKPKSWTIESFQNGQWTGDSTTGLFSFRFWQPTRVEYFQNGLIKIVGQ